VIFSERVPAPVEEHVDPTLGPHQVLGRPKLGF
jgi:hypothetical protein